MKDIIVGYTNEKDYTLFGKLADGTPIYKYTPPPPPDPAILRESENRKKEDIKINISI